MECVLVATTHWDREWYRTFQAFRARLVDTVDSVLDHLDRDPGYRFALDGQSVVVEDYLEVRPHNRERLERAVRDGRIAIGPWYVQPDSFLPSGEAHVRNLLEGRRVAAELGPVSTVGYTPDSFGHPAQFPQLFCGFGLEPFVYWRGNGNEIMELPAEYLWVAPDGSGVPVHHLWRGYGTAAAPPGDPEATAARLKDTVEKLATRTNGDRVLLLAGSDHQLPEPQTAEIAEALERATGMTVRRGLLEDFVRGLVDGELPRFAGELAGARIAHLLPGVWSTRTYLKLRNRRCETMLEAWAEPWVALGRVVGAPDERPALRSAWRELLRNQAHDSICGCSQDAVHDQMLARYDASGELANETTQRALERISGLGNERRWPWTDELDIAVFNPSPHPRTDVVRLAQEPYPPFAPGGERDLWIHPFLFAGLRPKGFEVDGEPARLVPAEGTGRVRLIPHQHDWDIELVVHDVPAFGWKRMRLRPSEEHPEEEDDGREIAAGDVSVAVADDGTFTVRFGAREYTGLGALEDTGDRGDSYDFDPVPGACMLGDLEVRRARHPSGIERLWIHRWLAVPQLTTDREERDTERHRYVECVLEARVAPGVERVDVRAYVQNEATDHRLRLLFPTGAPVERFRAATTFDVRERVPATPDDTGWRQPAPRTFPHQGWVEANGLTVAAPGLPEAEVTDDGVITITLLRAVGWLSRTDLRTRPEPAGPSLPTPGAQCQGLLVAELSLLPGADPRAARDAEVGLRATAAGSSPLVDEGASLVRLEPRELVLSALKPAEEGAGIVLRVLNPTDAPLDAVVELGFDTASAEAVRLDETPVDQPVEVGGRTLRFPVPPHALRSVLLTP